MCQHRICAVASTETSCVWVVLTGNLVSMSSGKEVVLDYPGDNLKGCVLFSDRN